METLQTAALLSLNTLGIVEWIKGFTAKASGQEVNGNILRLMQLAVALALSLCASYLPSFVLQALTVLSCTTLYKTDITEAGKTLMDTLTSKGKST